MSSLGLSPLPLPFSSPSWPRSPPCQPHATQGVPDASTSCPQCVVRALSVQRTPGAHAARITTCSDPLRCCPHHPDASTILAALQRLQPPARLISSHRRATPCHPTCSPSSCQTRARARQCHTHAASGPCTTKPSTTLPPLLPDFKRTRASPLPPFPHKRPCFPLGCPEPLKSPSSPSRPPHPLGLSSSPMSSSLATCVTSCSGTP